MRTVLATLVKDEQRYIREWVEYHHSLGFDSVHIIEDMGSGSHKNELYGLDYVVFHDVSEYSDSDDGQIRQMRCATYLLNDLRSEFGFGIFLDIDEFIRFGEGWDLRRLMHDFRYETGVLLKWRNMTASGHVKRPEGLVQDCYTEHNDCYLEFPTVSKVKVFVRLDSGFRYTSVHHVLNAVTMKGTNNLQDCDTDKVWIDHYQTKSWEDWIEQIDVRGDLIEGHRSIEDFFTLNPEMEHLKEDLLNDYSNTQLSHGRETE